MESAIATARSNGDVGKIETDIPARLDRLPWSRFHWLIVIGLGTVWILDGLEVTIVGSIASRLTEKGSGITIDAGQIGTAAAFYVAGACIGALFFGQLTDRFGRKRLFLLTLLLYIAATVATAFAFAPWYLFLMRFFTGAGIGGEYAAINSAIDELIPARVRGRVDLIINGSFWVGAALGAIASIFLLDTSIFAMDVGWRLAFGLGAFLGFAILLVRRHVPESPRWLFIHGREREAEAIVGDIEQAIEEETGQRELPEPRGTIAVRQRKRISFGEIARVAFSKYPRRAILGLSLFVGQAFLYNAVTFDLGTLLTTFFKVSAGAVPIFFAIFAVGNFLGPLTLGRLFDTVGRRPMITISYLGAALGLFVLALLVGGESLTKWSFLAFIVGIFFLASAGASSAYLTVSEIFPMETRALAIAFFYAVGTAIGGITGPLLFGHMIKSGDPSQLELAFLIGAGAMAIGGIAELFLGVRAEQRSLEEIATPLTAEEVEQPERDAGPEEAAVPRARERADEEHERAGQLEELADAVKERAEAAEQRAEAEEISDEEPRRAREMRDEAAQRERRAREREETIRRGIEQRRERDRTGLRRYRPGPGRVSSSPGFWVSEPVGEDEDLGREIDVIMRALEENSPAARDELERLVGGRFWGPGRFRRALREAAQDGDIRRIGRNTYAAAEGESPDDRPAEPVGAGSSRS